MIPKVTVFNGIFTGFVSLCIGVEMSVFFLV